MIRYWTYQIWEDGPDGDEKQVASVFTFHEAMRQCIDRPNRFIRHQDAVGEYAKMIKTQWKEV